ncbi:MAG: hypothetical protein QGI93_15025, partial [Planctomycetota bacterium]|nr:hypothetical protein [Planctomycetota bacterium]
MQTRQLLLTGLLLSTPALAFPPLQDREAPSKEIKELVEKARAQAELLREQVDASGERMEVKHFSLTSRATASSGTDRGYLGIEPTFEGGVMVVGRVMPGSGA